MDYQPAKTVLLFRAAWDYVPVSVLSWIRYLPMNPFRRLLNLNNLFREYGKQILREQGPEVDAERKARSKDMMSLLSESYIRNTINGGTIDGIIHSYTSSQGKLLRRRQNAPGRRGAHRRDEHPHARRARDHVGHPVVRAV